MDKRAYQYIMRQKMDESDHEVFKKYKHNMTRFRYYQFQNETIIWPALFKNYIINITLSIKAYIIQFQYKMITAIHIIRKIMNKMETNNKRLPNTNKNDYIENSIEQAANRTNI